MSTTPAIMIQATGSDAGKSLIVSGLCRYLTNQGLNVSPFKPQNMSNNAAVTEDGGEIGRAQALQAKACKKPASFHMNPVLLKPEGERGAQIVVQGKVYANAKAADYLELKTQLLTKVLESFETMQRQSDFVVVEGAGSPAEVNLRKADIANMGFAEAANVPVILLADIDRGGVIANLVGTHNILPEEERKRIKGFIVNKFRGDPALFTQGVERIEQETGWPCLGIIPWFNEANRLPAEDSMALENKMKRAGENEQRAIHISVPRLPRIANFDDLDPLAAEPDVNIDWIDPGNPIPANTDLVLLAGSKATILDLQCLKDEGWDIDIKAHVRRGGKVLGLCGGYQMLGRNIHDPEHIEGDIATIKGLGLLDVETTLAGNKRLANVKISHAETGLQLTGYEIHMGRTIGPDRERPFLLHESAGEGAISMNGQIIGTYIHGLFVDDKFRSAFLKQFRGMDQPTIAYDATIEDTLDKLATHLEQAIDIKTLKKIAGAL